ncbi:hypothetical protein B566_EDAN013424 [Ephemera danica]|nr:hypothetical protein B566_EDAN013424 [Ephemera danica]
MPSTGILKSGMARRMFFTHEPLATDHSIFFSALVYVGPRVRLLVSVVRASVDSVVCRNADYAETQCRTAEVSSSAASAVLRFLFCLRLRFAQYTYNNWQLCAKSIRAKWALKIISGWIEVGATCRGCVKLIGLIGEISGGQRSENVLVNGHELSFEGADGIVTLHHGEVGAPESLGESVVWLCQETGARAVMLAVICKAGEGPASDCPSSCPSIYEPNM